MPYHVSVIQRWYMLKSHHCSGQRGFSWQPNLCICLMDGESLYTGEHKPIAHSTSLSLSLTHAIVMFFFFKPLRGNHRVNIQYSQALQHTQTHTGSHYSLYKGWVIWVRRESFAQILSSSMPLNEWPRCASVTKRYVSAHLETKPYDHSVHNQKVQLIRMLN